MRARRWGAAAASDRGPLACLDPKPRAEAVTTSLVRGRGTPTTGTLAACLPSRALAEAVPGERSTAAADMRCAERMQAPLGLARRCMMSWRRWAHRRRILAALQGIQARAVTSHLLSIFYRWFLFATRAAAVRHLEHSLAREAFVSLVCRYWQRWRLAARLRRKRSQQLARLRGIRYEAERSLAWRHCVQWRAAAERRVELRRKVAAVSESCTIRLAHNYFAAWVRWRQRNLHTKQLRLIAHAAYRSLARRTLQKWSLLVSRSIVAWDMERRTLESFVQGFFLRWRRYASLCKALCRIGHAAYWRVARRAFHKWKLWFVRIVVALQLERRSLLPLLQVYFFRWVMLRRVRRLEYNAFVSSLLH
ncbi:uncharacterized protein Tco025E_04346 [Trypanosoma conorhini]|uniref:Uncharacterized protein n=1 Tax=Trypanosoma conorhini TaxID=83891 RepID=A0A3R7S160_9TRYP|nr:uncharacterized protein Tco025E_04346 [Trypanosoma conorhini]RNF18955.1 hypothetical protein Tco025E_04346 [Trypanosoma conorhini]